MFIQLFREACFISPGIRTDNDLSHRLAACSGDDKRYLRLSRGRGYCGASG